VHKDFKFQREKGKKGRKNFPEEKKGGRGKGGRRKIRSAEPLPLSLKPLAGPTAKIRVGGKGEDCKKKEKKEGREGGERGAVFYLQHRRLAWPAKEEGRGGTGKRGGGGGETAT